MKTLQSKILPKTLQLTGNLDVKSVPDGATIYLDNVEQIGIATPAIIPNLPVGIHDIRLIITNAYTYEWTGTVYIASGRTTYLNVVLMPIGNLNIASNPAGATIYIDDIEQVGITTPAIIQDLASGTHTYMLSLYGYAGITGTFEIIPGQTTIIDLELIKLDTGNLSITSDPEDAVVIIDKSIIGITPSIISNLPIGTHTYKMILTGYYDTIGAFEILPNQTTSLSQTLVPIPPPTVTIQSYLYISSTPIGARIYIDDTDIGYNTPMLVPDLSQGTHTYKLILSNYEDVTDTFDILPNQATIISDTLVAITSDVYFNSHPQGARIYIDDTDTGYSTPMTITDIPAGMHSHTLRLANYNDYTGIVIVHEEELAHIDAVLIPSEGCVSFNSIPSGADLSIEGIGRKFITPEMVCDLPLGRLEYHLRYPEYEPFDEHIILVPGHGEIINVTLEEK